MERLNAVATFVSAAAAEGKGGGAEDGSGQPRSVDFVKSQHECALMHPEFAKSLGFEDLFILVTNIGALGSQLIPRILRCAERWVNHAKRTLSSDMWGVLSQLP